MRVFKGICNMGRNSYGWFMGYKLHLIINNKGEIMSIKFTKGNKSDILVLSDLTKGLKGKFMAIMVISTKKSGTSFIAKV
ncbi:MAG: transposase [Rickettsiaceae bacterium]|jgi:hypothetical protein|nr:transposase [Rickettsiaceae bacterium]